MAPQPFIPLPDGAQVELVNALDAPPGSAGSLVMSRLWFLRRTGVPTLDNLQELADGVGSWWLSSVMPLLSHDLTFFLCRATAWQTAFDLSQAFIPTPTPGGSLDTSHSANVAVRVRFKSASAPTDLYNANFVGGIPRDVVDHNTVSEVFKSALFEAYVALIDLAPEFGTFPAWRWVCTSRRHDNAWRAVQLARRTDFITVPSAYVSPRRRRLPKPPSTP